MLTSTPHHVIPPVEKLYRTLLTEVVSSPHGSAFADAQIASVLGVPALPYTSNDVDARKLLPAGWHWGVTAHGNPSAVRDSDGAATNDFYYPTPGASTVASVPSPLMRCCAAVIALMMNEDVVA